MLVPQMTLPKIKLGLKPLPDDFKRDLAKIIIDVLIDRVGYRHEDATGARLEENRGSWLDFKESHGFSPHPLVMTGTMTEPISWEWAFSTDRIEVRLKGFAEEKWDTIVEKADERITWLRAFQWGDDITEAIMVGVNDWLKDNWKQLLSVRFN